MSALPDSISTMDTSSSSSSKTLPSIKEAESKAEEESNEANPSERRPSIMQRMSRSISSIPQWASDRSTMEGLLKQADESLDKFLNGTDFEMEESIPQMLLKNSVGIIIFTVLKGGWGIGGCFGSGVLLVRNKDGRLSSILRETPKEQRKRKKKERKSSRSSSSSSESSSGLASLSASASASPSPATSKIIRQQKLPSSKDKWSLASAVGIGGLNWGLQWGATKIEYIVVINDPQSLKPFLSSGQLKIGGDIGASIGPKGRNIEASLATDFGSVNSVAPLMTYSLSKGIYLGLTIDGSVFHVRSACNKNYYGGIDVPIKHLLDNSKPKPQGFVNPENKHYNHIVQMLDDYIQDDSTLTKMTMEVQTVMSRTKTAGKVISAVK